MNLMGGKIKVESEKGKGTLFSVYLYIDPVRDYSPAPEINPEKGAASLQNRTFSSSRPSINTELAKRSSNKGNERQDRRQRKSRRAVQRIRSGLFRRDLMDIKHARDGRALQRGASGT